MVDLGIEVYAQLFGGTFSANVEPEQIQYPEFIPLSGSGGCLEHEMYDAEADRLAKADELAKTDELLGM
jgi:hypothetical protein